MLISYTHQFIFFHVAKVAGLSIRQALEPYIELPEKFKIKRPPQTVNGQPNPLYVMWESSLTHAKAQDTQKELGAAYDKFFKFAFVRNPWDWQVSMYHFLLKETANPRYELVKACGNFENYLEWVIATKNPYPKGATKLQSALITNSQGQLMVDFIGRFETLSEDFASICDILHLAASLPHINQSSHRDYRSYYTDYTRQLIADHFATDIAMFGYTFDGYITPFDFKLAH
jgi:hypothetical protein